MNTSLVIQTLALSGALGFLGLEYLQDHNAVTRTLSGTDKNVYRVVLGVIDYLIYLVIYAMLSLGSLPEMIQVIVAITITGILAAMYTYAYGKWARNHGTLSNGSNQLDAREMALKNPYGNGYIQADMFDLIGNYIGSGFLRDVNLQAGISPDISMVSLSEGYTAHTDQSSADESAQLVYIDASSGIKYYLTYFSEQGAE